MRGKFVRPKAGRDRRVVWPRTMQARKRGAVTLKGIANA